MPPVPPKPTRASQWYDELAEELRPLVANRPAGVTLQEVLGQPTAQKTVVNWGRRHNLDPAFLRRLRYVSAMQRRGLG